MSIHVCVCVCVSVSYHVVNPVMDGRVPVPDGRVTDAEAQS